MRCDIYIYIYVIRRLKVNVILPSTSGSSQWFPSLLWTVSENKRDHDLKNCRVLNVLFFLLDDSPASEVYIPTFRNTFLFQLHRRCRQENNRNETVGLFIFEPHLFPYIYPNISQT